METTRNTHNTRSVSSKTIQSAQPVQPQERSPKTMKKITAKEAAAQLRNLTKQERARIDAQITHDHFGRASDAIGCDEETIAKTWKKYRHLIEAVVRGIMSGELHSTDI